MESNAGGSNAHVCLECAVAFYVVDAVDPLISEPDFLVGFHLFALLGCHGGVLTIGGEQFRIQVLDASNTPHQVERVRPGVHINVSSSVFVLYEMTEKGPDPIATAFAISSTIVMTAAHNVVTRELEDESKNEQMSDKQEMEARGQDFCTNNLMIAHLLHKDTKGVVTVEGDAISVTLARYHYFHDWAFLKVSDGVELTSFIPVGTAPEDLPQRGTLDKIYIYHCPVKIFRESRKQTSVHAMPKEASVGIISEKSLSFQNGGFSGSCGGPYVFRNKVVAFHTASENDVVDFEMLDEHKEVGGRKRKKTILDKTKEVAESCTSSHTCLGTGTILQARSGIMKILSGEISI